MLVDIFFSLLIICFSVLMIIFTIYVSKKLLDDIFDEFKDDFLMKRGARNFAKYVIDNSEKEFPAFDLQDRKAICDTLKDIHNDERWIDK